MPDDEDTLNPAITLSCVRDGKPLKWKELAGSPSDEYWFDGECPDGHKYELRHDLQLDLFSVEEFRDDV